MEANKNWPVVYVNGSGQQLGRLDNPEYKPELGLAIQCSNNYNGTIVLTHGVIRHIEFNEQEGVLLAVVA